jgi:SAM-dependent methyltransferase
MTPGGRKVGHEARDDRAATIGATVQHHHHQHSPDGPASGTAGAGDGSAGTVEFTQEYWDDRYRSAGRLWTGRPNAQLVAQTAGLPPGAALDAGCGEGGDAIWLAGRGWTVTAVDVSAVALERAAAQAADAGAQTAARISWQREDLLTWDPGPARFDLVTAQFIHLPQGYLESLHRRLAAAVRPGGTLLVVGHHPDDLHANVGRTGPRHLFVSAAELAAALDPGDWEIAVATAVARPETDVDGHPATVKDTVLRAVRRNSPREPASA